MSSSGPHWGRRIFIIGQGHDPRESYLNDYHLSNSSRAKLKGQHRPRDQGAPTANTRALASIPGERPRIPHQTQASLLAQPPCPATHRGSRGADDLLKDTKAVHLSASASLSVKPGKQTPPSFPAPRLVPRRRRLPRQHRTHPISLPNLSFGAQLRCHSASVSLSMGA